MTAESATAAFREKYRREEISDAYRGWPHLAFTSAVCLAVVWFCAARVEQPGAVEWLTIPVMFLYSNLVEYFGHRGPMHHPVRMLGLVFRRHTLQHHRFFTNEEMAYESSRDFKAVLFPPMMILFFIGLFGVPAWVVLHFLASDNVAWLAVATGIAYYLNYEWLHFAYHCRPDSRVGRLPGVQRLRGLHLRHHDPKLMTRCNFNITYPIGDWLFGTYRGASDPG